ncbi:hypothetical protein [Limobrevibacterium gyesilva]|uniref:Outer membrane protein assembly factor BamE n=1 Tax=Limobrevibacterium gyesilva TaxID=2991712 RepID=A0AA41YQS9_9PROT|nr:hypothetical protein [Limobrevibacterium gyesilva]MCW3476578.1 hypothetical protein [Limobrevibacterium gyesilva]
MRRTLALSLLLLLGACQGAAEQAAAVRQGQDVNRLTVGTVQRQIRVGMPNSEVAEVLGAPNMVTTDENRREVWVYDRISTDTVSSSSSGGATILILGASAGAAARSTSQRTLTVIVKFDEANRVRDFAYRSSSF